MDDQALLDQLNESLVQLMGTNTKPEIKPVKWEPIPGLEDQVRRTDFQAGVWENSKGNWAAGVPVGSSGQGYDFSRKWGATGFASQEEAMRYADQQIASLERERQATDDGSGTGT